MIIADTPVVYVPVAGVCYLRVFIIYEQYPCYEYLMRASEFRCIVQHN